MLTNTIANYFVVGYFMCTKYYFVLLRVIFFTCLEPAGSAGTPSDPGCWSHALSAGAVHPAPGRPGGATRPGSHGAHTR